MPSAFLALFIPICYNPIMPSALHPISISPLDSHKIQITPTLPHLKNHFFTLNPLRERLIFQLSPLTDGVKKLKNCSLN
jgi:hypothetical protein